MDFVLDAIEFIADHGHRFLPLYNFDWKTGSWDFASDPKPAKAFGNGRRIWRRFPHLSGALRRHIPFINEGKARREVVVPPYKEYIRSAKEIAEGLSNLPRTELLPPEEVDPQLVTFML